MKLLNTLLSLTALLGYMPALLCVLSIQVAMAHGAGEWPELVFDMIFVSLYLLLLGLGSYLHSVWFR